MLYLPGYDKLKPYGFPIHGAIDGYSRKILWLEVARSNNKPQIPAAYYIDAVLSRDGCPFVLRTDCGTENGIMATLQCYAHQDGEDDFASENAHRYGSSPANQRILEFWTSGILDIGNQSCFVGFVLHQLYRTVFMFATISIIFFQFFSSN